MEQQRKIIFFRTYFEDFVNTLSTGVREKIAYVLFTITVSPRIPSKFYEHLTGTDGLYVIRVEYESNIYRIFCCFDHGMLVVLFNGFQKKTRKTPRSEIDKALKIKEEYFKSKREGIEK